jgi:hypothetical protein
MKISKSILLIAAVLLAACNFPGTTPKATSPPDAPPQPSEPSDQPGMGPLLAGVDTLAPFFLACPGSALSLLANFELHPAGMQSVMARYRWNGGSSAAYSWNEIELASEGTRSGYDQYSLTLADAGSEAETLFADQSGAFEYQIIATGNDGGTSQWPSGDDVFILPVDPCSDAPYIVDDYGVSSTSAGYGPGCSPTEVTFEIILRGVSRVEQTWLEYSFVTADADPQVLPDELVVDLQGPTPVLAIPGAVSFTYTIDLNTDAAAALSGEAGVMFWNGYVMTDDGMVFEYPVGGPPEVAIESCSN